LLSLYESFRRTGRRTGRSKLRVGSPDPEYTSKRKGVDDFLFVVRDNASQHVTPKLDDFLESNRDRLCLVPLPTYSPNLNLIERLWHYMRDNITRSHFYVTLNAQCEALIEWFDTLPIQRFLSLVGLSP